MNELLNRLVTDHKHFNQVKSCLKKEMHAYFTDQRELDVGLLLDIMYYIRNYSDCFHHPLEDRLYRKMRHRIDDDTMLSMLERIESEHAELDVRTRRLQDDFYALEDGEQISKAKLKIDFFEYIDMSETHIASENEYLFPAIERYLLESDVASIDRALRRYSDPVFESNLPGAVGL